MKVVLISGPTASGKTDLSIEIAERINAEIVNFDSLLFYQEICIGTAKPTEQEMARIPHHMINIRSIKDPMNAADFSKMAIPLVNQIIDKRKNVVLVGGSGFYLQALLKGMYHSPTTPVEIQKKSDELYQSAGIEPFINFLRENDPESFNRYHENDHYRIRRAVEHFWTSGTPLSKERVKKDESNSELKETTIHGWDLLHIYLDIPKEEHLEIIKKRTHKMIELGLYDEVKNLLSHGFTGTEKPLQSIGYKEILDFHFKVYKSLDECIERIIISTRQLAKSQRTWFNRDQSKEKFHPLAQRKDIFKRVDEFINN